MFTGLGTLAYGRVVCMTLLAHVLRAICRFRMLDGSSPQSLDPPVLVSGRSPWLCLVCPAVRVGAGWCSLLACDVSKGLWEGRYGEVAGGCGVGEAPWPLVTHLVTQPSSFPVPSQPLALGDWMLRRKVLQ